MLLHVYLECMLLHVYLECMLLHVYLECMLLHSVCTTDATRSLQNNAVHRSVKPHILSAIGDVALSIGPQFKKYLDIVLKILMQASQLQVDKVGEGLACLFVFGWG